MKTHAILKHAGIGLVWLVFLCLPPVGQAQADSVMKPGVATIPRR